MNKLMKIAMGASACLGILITSSAQAQGTANWYGGLSGDLTWMQHTDVGGGANIDLGYRFMPNDMGAIRLEGEIGYHGADGDSGYGDTHLITYMGNAYYDFKGAFAQTGSGWSLTPYLGAGIGDAEVHHGNGGISTTFHHNENTFAYQGMAGVTLTTASMPNADWSLGYRYIGTDEHNVEASNIELGLRFYF